MAATILNSSGIEDDQKSWKSYYIKIIVDDRIHHKFGICKGTVKKRYSKEPSSTVIEIIRIWIHTSDEDAREHEELLFREYPGDRPYFGRCGPLKYGGNTETYSHDVMSNEPAPHSYKVRMFSNDDLTLYTVGYATINPKEPYRDLYGEVKYMDYAFGPKDSFLQIPCLSHPTTVTLATYDYLLSEIESFQRMRSGTTQKYLANKYLEAIKYGLYIRKWTDYSEMKFESSTPFIIEQWENWV